MEIDPNTQKILEEQKANCIFCSIVLGKIPSQKIYEDEKTVAILDINPAAPGHILLMTKEHYPIMPLIPTPEIYQLGAAIKKLGATMLKKLGVTGYNVFIANGAAAGQKAPHFILHIIPRRENDGLTISIKQKIVENEQTLKEITAALNPQIQRVLNYTQAGVTETQETAPTSEPETTPEEKTESQPQKKNDVNLDDISGLF